MAPTIITWPTQEEAIVISEKFAAFSGIPGIIGVVDGSYIPIKAPSVNPEVYINRKCFHGITLQAICDYDRKFTDTFTGYPSSVSDIRIFRNSDIYRMIEEERDRYFPPNSFIIGDKAYPIMQWCVPPYIDRGNMLEVEKNFNKLHAKARQVIERAFALLFGRLRRLRYLDMNRIDLIPSTIIACCVIHNMCLNYEDEQAEYEDEGRQFLVEPGEQDMNIQEQTGILFRNRLARRVYNF